MTEQEYCDLSDLQICRSMLMMARSAYCFEGTNKERLKIIAKNLSEIINDLEPIVSENID